MRHKRKRLHWHPESCPFIIPTARLWRLSSACWPHPCLVLPPAFENVVTTFYREEYAMLNRLAVHRSPFPAQNSQYAALLMTRDAVMTSVSAYAKIQSLSSHTHKNGRELLRDHSAWNCRGCPTTNRGLVVQTSPSRHAGF